MQNAVAIVFLIAGAVIDVYFIRRAVECFERREWLPAVLWLLDTFCYIAIPLSLIYR